MREEHDGKFIFKVNILSRLLKPVEISHEWMLTNLKYQEPESYAKLFDESERGSFEVPPGRTKKYEMRKSSPGAPKLYVYQERKIACVGCSL